MESRILEARVRTTTCKTYECQCDAHLYDLLSSPMRINPHACVRYAPHADTLFSGMFQKSWFILKSEVLKCGLFISFTIIVIFIHLFSFFEFLFHPNVYPGGKIGVLPILTTGAVPFRLEPVSNASAADQHCAKRWHTTGAALAKRRRSTAFQCWQTTNICVLPSIGAALNQHRRSTDIQCWQTTNFWVMPSVGAAPAWYRFSVLAINKYRVMSSIGAALDQHRHSATVQC